MPATSKSERQAMAIAEHEPEKLYERNKGLLRMSKSQLHDFASTKESGLPERKRESLSQYSGRKKQTRKFDALRGK